MPEARSFDYLQAHLKIVLTTSPKVSSTAAQTNAELKFAIWNCHGGIRKMPATSGTEARNGPKKRPMKIASTPALHECFAFRQQFGMARQRPHVRDWRSKLDTDPVGQPVTERGPDRTRNPNRPEIEIAGAD